MIRYARGLAKARVSFVVGAVVAIAVLGGLIDLMISAHGDSLGPPPPMGRACERLLEQQGPDLMAQANRLVEDRAAVSAIADCDSGAFPSAEGPTDDRAPDIVQRMKMLGTVEQRSPTECLKYLKPAECGEVWAFQPRDNNRHYVISLEPRTYGVAVGLDHAGAEFSIERDR